MKPKVVAAAIVLWAGSPADAHRLDEYLQAVIVSVEAHRVDAQMTLTPGVSVFSQLIEEIDTNSDGAISPAEQHAYAARVLGDLSLRIDDQPLQPQLLSLDFPAIEDMQEGRGEIHIEFDADVPPGRSERKLTLQNRHMSRIAAYQVNVLVSRDPDIRILAQNRNYTQSLYELEYSQAGGTPVARSFAWLRRFAKPLSTMTLLLFGWAALLVGLRIRPFKDVRGPQA